MKIFRFISFSLILTAAFALCVAAQTTPTTAAAPTKIGFIDSSAFLSEKDGIKKYVAAMTTVNAEFKTPAAELDTLGTKIQTLEKELTAFQEQKQKNVQVNEATVNAKLEEYDKATREYKFKKENAEAQYGRRQEALLTPVRQDIGKALLEFAKKNGYAMIIDISKDQNGFFIALDDKVDVTKDFIAFYNARATTAATK